MRRFVIFGAVIAVIVAIWSAGWLVIAGQIRTEVDRLALNDGQTAPRLACGTLNVAGYPFRFNITCADATITAGDLSFALPRIEAAALVFQPTLYHVRGASPLTVKDAFLGGENRIAWTSLEGSLRLADWSRLARLSLVADEAAWADTLVTETLIGSATRAELHLIDVPARHDPAAGRAVLEGYLLLDGTAIPSWTVADGDLTATVELTGLPDSLLALPADPLRDWQAAGGALTITEIKAWEGEDTVTVTGEMSLSAEGLANGTIEIVSQGVANRTAAAMPPELQPLIFGFPGEDGTSRQRLSFTNGLLIIGMLPILQIPPLF
jgi:hypothetical protein